MRQSTAVLHNFVVLIAASSLACASPGEGAKPNQSTLTSPGSAKPASSVATTSVPSTTGVPSSPGASPSAAPLPSGDDTEAIERENAGCKFRKSTNKISACAKHTKSVGAWVPNEAEFAEVATLTRGACYCVTGLDSLAKECMGRVKSPNVTFTVGMLGEPTDCTVTVSSNESHKRRFLRVHAANRDVATFYATLSIYEQKAGSLASYFTGFNGINDTDVLAGEEGVSADMKREWKSLPKDLRDWITTD